MADTVNPQLTDILGQLTLMREGLDSITLDKQIEKKDKKKDTKDLVKVRIDDIKDSALDKIVEALGDISDNTKASAKGKKGEKDKSSDLSGLGGAMGKFIGEAFGSGVAAAGPYGPLIALGIGGGIGLAALGIAGAIRIIAPALPQIMAFIKDALPEIGKFVKDLMPAFAQFINDVLGGEGFLKFIHTITDFWRNVLKDMFEAIPEIMKGIGIAIESILMGVADIAKQIPAIIDAIAGGVAVIITPITKAIQKVLSDFVQILPDILAQIPPIMAAIVPFFEIFMDFAKTAMHDIIDFCKYLIKNLPIIKDFMLPIIDLIKDLAGKYLEYLKIVIIGLKDTIIELIDKGLNPLILGLRDVLISLFENLSKIVTDVMAAVMTLANCIVDIIVPAITVLGRVMMGIIDVIKLLIDKGFSLMETALNTISDILDNVMNFFETMPGKISEFIASVVQSVKELATIPAKDLLEVAAGITAVAGSLTLLGAGGLVQGFLGLFSADPIKQLQRFINLKDGLTETAKSIRLLSEALKDLGTEGLGKSIGANLKEVSEAIKKMPIETIKIATSLQSNREVGPSKISTATAGASQKENIVKVLEDIKNSIDSQLTSAVSNTNSILTDIASLLNEKEMGTQNSVIVNQPSTNQYEMGGGSSTADWRARAAA